MRIITVDNGNTNPHVGIFQDEQLIRIIPLKDYSPLPDDFILISDVGGALSFKPSFDLKTKRQDKKFFDMPVNYTETLGDDRLIIAYALFKQLGPYERILVIDAGTFITTDLIDESGFVGGFIFPGLQTFLSSYQKGSKLPLLEMKKDFKLNELPHSTEEAILGATNIYLSSILESTITKTAPSKIIITGGSLELIKKRILENTSLKLPIETYPHLLHSSLFAIYHQIENFT